MTQSLRVVVYTKPGCGLCGPAIEVVERVQKDVALSLEKVDISGDRALLAKYGQEVPVLTINGRKAFKGRISENQLRKKLKRALEGDDEPALDAAPPPLALESLESLEPPPFVPPRPIAAAVVLLTIGVFSWFLTSGFIEAQHGRGKLAGDLLRAVPPKTTNVPVQFSLESLTGSKVSLQDFRGKVVFLNFWATWCPPCVEEMPSMVRMHQRLKSNPKFVLLAVSADDSWEPVRQFFADKGQPEFTVLLDAQGKVAKQYGTTMFPETYVIVDGKIIGFIEGPRDWDEWFSDEYLKSLL